MFEIYRDLAASFGLRLRFPESQEPLELGGQTHEQALRSVHEMTRVPLESSRIRVGVSRGHLLEVVVQVPLDVGAREDDLQIAAETYLEHRLGTALLDEWVGSIDVDRIARTSGLLVVSDQRSSAQSHPLREGADLVRRGVDGICCELPCSLLEADRAEPDWTALDIPPTESGLQADRRFASTRFPEALKCALEGMPFRSSRFTRGGERFCWLSWQGSRDLEVRMRLREEVESILSSAKNGRKVLISGTGFSKARDYVDLWLDPTWGGLSATILAVVGRVGELEFGVYDTPLSAHPLRVNGLVAPPEPNV